MVWDEGITSSREPRGDGLSFRGWSLENQECSWTPLAPEGSDFPWKIPFWAPGDGPRAGNSSPASCPVRGRRGMERRTESWNGSGVKGCGRVRNSIGMLPTIPGCSKPLPTCPGMFWGGFGQELFGIRLGQVSFLGKDVGKRVSAKNPRKHRELWERDIFHPGAGVFRTELGRFGGPWEFAFPISLSLVPPNPLKSL